MDELRNELRNLGYLTSHIERWFTANPWSSRGYSAELLLVNLKASTLAAFFFALCTTSVMMLRNRPLDLATVVLLFFTYAAVLLGIGSAAGILTSILMHVRPAVVVDRPRLLTASAAVPAAVLASSVVWWWSGFAVAPSWTELAVAAPLLLLAFAVAIIVYAAALLSLSIHETHRLPVAPRRSQTRPIAFAGAVLLLFVLTPAMIGSGSRAAERSGQIIVTPATARVALIAVDGMTGELLRTRADLASLFRVHHQIPAPPPGSSPEIWATAGTGVPASIHGVRAVEAIHFRGARAPVQEVSDHDIAIRNVAPFVRVAERVPLPPTLRLRDFVWEIAAARGIPSAAVNWWTTEPSRNPLLASIPQESIHARAGAASPLERAKSVDATTAATLLRNLPARTPALAVAYLPGLEVISNRLQIDATQRFAATVETLDRATALVRDLRSRGWEIVLAGLPAPGQGGHGVVAATVPLVKPESYLDVAPTLLDLVGFPRSAEMTGRSLLPESTQTTVPTFGERTRAEAAVPVSREYYESLRSLGYIQ